MPRPKKQQPNHAGGLYEIKITTGKSLDGKLRRKSFYSDISKEDAREKSRQWQIEQSVAEQTNSAFIEKDIDFSSWADKWLEIYKKPYVTENTYNGTYLLYVDQHIKPYFKRIPLRDVRAADVERFYASKQELSGSALHKIQLCLNGIFETAIANDLCYKNPAKFAKYKSEFKGKEKQVYSESEIETVWPKMLARMPGAALILETGLRCGELMGLRWADIYDDAIHVERSIAVGKKHEFSIRPPKWNSYRAIPLSRRALQALDRIEKTDEYLFPRKPGIPYTPRTWANKLLAFMREVHAENDRVPILSPHELRHTYGTRLRRRGIDIYTIQKVMGHKDVNITSETYVHNELDTLRQAMGL